MSLLSAPISVFVSITYKCNLRCRHCAVYSEAIAYDDLDSESWIRFFHELAELKVFRVRLSGGEPFMRHDIWRLIDIIHSLPMRLSINTNATLIDKEAAGRLSLYRKIDEIMVSLDGSCPETHDPLRGKGTFREVYRGIENLVRSSLPVSFYCTVNRYNFRELDKIAQLALEWGRRPIKFNDLLPEGRGLKNYKDLSLKREEWEEALNLLGELRRTYGPVIAGTILDQGDMYDSMRHMGREDLQGLPPNSLSGCGALIRECAVRPDGWITPCDRLPDLKAGHIHEHRFREIWHSSEVFETFRKRREVLLSELEECRGCLYHPVCTGGCPAAPYVLYGTVMTRDPLGCYRIYLGEEAFNVL